VLVLSLGALTLLFLFLFSPTHDWLGLPPALQGLRRVSPASIAALVRPRVDEIHGLLYYAVQENEALADDLPDPTRPIDLSVYADGDPAPNWPARVKLLDEVTPLIVFSKVRPWSVSYVAVPGDMGWANRNAFLFEKKKRRIARE
jgi:hypothetical protein